MNMPAISDSQHPVRRYQWHHDTGAYVATPQKKLFIRGPIPLAWVSAAANLPGKTLNVAMALRWLEGMNKGKPFKLTRKALKMVNVERDAASAGLNRLEQAGLIKLERKPGQRPYISILECRQN